MGEATQPQGRRRSQRPHGARRDPPRSPLTRDTAGTPVTGDLPPEQTAALRETAEARERARRSGRTKFHVSRWRRYYAETLCAAVNDPLDADRFPSVVPQEKDGPLRVRDACEFPVVEIAVAVAKVVKGEEDRDWALYREGVEYLFRFLRKNPPRVEPALIVLEPARPRTPPESGQQPSPPTRPGKDPRPDPPVLQFGFEDDYRMEVRLSLEVLGPDGEWDSSMWLVREFLRYQLFHRTLVKLGVCHFEMCGRLYVKSWHRAARQTYCSRSCRDKGYRLAKEAAR